MDNQNQFIGKGASSPFSNDNSNMVGNGTAESNVVQNKFVGSGMNSSLSNGNSNMNRNDAVGSNVGQNQFIGGGMNSFLSNDNSNMNGNDAVGSNVGQNQFIGGGMNSFLSNGNSNMNGNDAVGSNVGQNQLMGNGVNFSSSNGNSNMNENGSIGSNVGQNQFMGNGRNIEPSNNLSTTDKQVINNGKGNNNKIKLVIIGAVVLVVLVIVAILIKNGILFSKHRNTTGSSEYKGSEVKLNCTASESENGKTITHYMDLLTGNGYKIYNKMVIAYDSGITDKIYLDFIKNIDLTTCLSKEEECAASNHLELGLTNIGFDTIVDRSGDKIEVTFYVVGGVNQTSTDDDIKELKRQFEKEGYSCK